MKTSTAPSPPLAPSSSLPLDGPYCLPCVTRAHLLLPLHHLRHHARLDCTPESTPAPPPRPRSRGRGPLGSSWTLRSLIYGIPLSDEFTTHAHVDGGMRPHTHTHSHTHTHAYPREKKLSSRATFAPSFLRGEEIAAAQIIARLPSSTTHFLREKMVKNRAKRTRFLPPSSSNRLHLHVFTKNYTASRLRAVCVGVRL